MAMVRLITFSLCIGVAGAACAQATTMTLPEAIARALAANPAAAVADAGSAEAEALRRSADAALLPQLGLAVSQTRQTRNLKAQGIDFPGAPSLVGPFSTFDARLRASQTVFDWSASLARRSARLGAELARAEAEAARERIAAGTALAYIGVLRSEAQTETAQADLELARQLAVLAQDRHDAGVASGVDVVRAQAQVAQGEFELARAEAAAAQARLSLQRQLDLPLDQPVHPVEQIDSGAAPQAPPALDAALADSRTRRPELRVAQQTVAQLKTAVDAAQARRLPTVQAFADYGLSGNTPNQNDEDTYAFGASLSLPLFAGGSIDAGIDAAQARLDQAEARLRDTEATVEQDVRLAYADLAAGREQLRASAAALDLAERELALARDRFAHGVANNVDVIQAQTQLSRARSNRTEALAGYQAARANLAAATAHAAEFHF